MASGSLATIGEDPHTTIAVSGQNFADGRLVTHPEPRIPACQATETKLNRRI